MNTNPTFDKQEAQESQPVTQQTNLQQQASSQHGQLPSPLKPTSKVTRKSSMHYVRSRDELLEEEKAHFEDLRKKIVKTRRTKIVGTISALYSSYDHLRDMVLAGMNSFMVNMAYCTPDLLVTLRRNRDALEKELNVQLPISCILKGTHVRIGTLIQPEIFLRKGQEYRIVLNNKVLGNNLYCAIDDKDIVKKIKIGNQIVIDYGQISMTIKAIEKSDESIKILKEQHKYEHDDFLETLVEKKRKFYPNLYFSREGSSDPENNPHNNFSEDDFININSHDIIEDNNNPSTVEGIQDHEKNNNLNGTPLGATSTTQNKFADRLRQKKLGKKKIYDVIVCEVDSDCLLKAFKPIFIYEKDIFQKREHLKKYKSKNVGSFEGQNIGEIGEQLSEDEDMPEDYEGEGCITPKDITDINCCLINDVDSICISNIRSARDLKAVRNLIGDNSGMRIMARIQTPEAVENFEEIVKASDGVQIARGYLTVHMPVEKLFSKQKEMIHKCHEHLKPVLISCNILDSMVSSLLPTMCEVGEISNLVSDYVDDIILSSETSFGNHPIEAIKTLSRICVEAEALRIMKRIQNPSNSDSVSIRSSKNAIPSCIINCSLEAAYQIHASIIVVFTTRGYTALKLSKLRPPCPIVAVTCHKKVARCLSQVSAVNSVLFDTLLGTESLITRVVEIQKQSGLLKTGDFIVITSGDIENVANQTNNLRIYVVQ